MPNTPLNIGGIVLPGQPLPGQPGTTASLTDSLNSILNSGLPGIGTSLLGSAIQQGWLNSGKDYITNNVGGAASGANTTGLAGAQGAYGQQNPVIGSILSGQNPWSQALTQGLMGNIGTLNNLLPSLVQGEQQNLAPGTQGLGANQVYQDPNASNALRGITDLSGNTSGLLNWAANMINNGGFTNSQVPLGNYAQALMGGTNPLQASLAAAGGNVLSNGGMNPALANALSQASGVVSGGGQTPLTNQLAQLGLNLAGNGSPLLSNNVAASFARDQSGQNFVNAANTARAQAQARGQGAGDIVASGTGNRAIGDMADQALSQSSNAMQQALLGQQGLGLQQLAQGLNTGLSAADIQRSLELGGLGSVAGLTGAATGALGTGGGLVNSALGAGNQGANIFNSLLGLQQSNLQQGLNEGNTAIGQQSGLMQQALQDILQGQTGAANIGNTLAQLYLQNQGQLGSAIGQGIGQQNNALGLLGNQAGNWLGYAGQGLGTLGTSGSALANLLKTPNQWGVTLNNLGSSLTGVPTGGPGVSINPSVVLTPPVPSNGGGSYFDPSGGFGGWGGTGTFGDPWGFFGPSTYGGGGGFGSGGLGDFSMQQAGRFTPQVSDAPQPLQGGQPIPRNRSSLGVGSNS